MPSEAEKKSTATAKKKTAKKKATKEKAVAKKTATTKSTTKKSTTKKSTTKKSTTGKSTAKSTTAPKKSTAKAGGSAGKLRVLQVRSGIGSARRVRGTLTALGLRHHQDEVVVPDNPSIRGMLMKVHHLVSVKPEEANA
jgi:large subunit ribosomal protein L30